MLGMKLRVASISKDSKSLSLEEKPGKEEFTW